MRKIEDLKLKNIARSARNQPRRETCARHGLLVYPSTVPEVGVDGHIEIRDLQTGEMTNVILQVQSKATERPWPRENNSSFDYICDEDDLQYWLAGTAQLILVLSRPSKEDAYWFRQNLLCRPPREPTIPQNNSPQGQVKI